MMAAREAEIREAEATTTHGRNGSTRKVSVKLPTSVVKLIEAAETLGIGNDHESFVVEATIEKAEGLRLKLQTVIGRENAHSGSSKGRRARGQS